MGEISQQQRDFQSDANQESKYAAVTLVGYVVEDQVVFHKIHQKGCRKMEVIPTVSHICTPWTTSTSIIS